MSIGFKFARLKYANQQTQYRMCVNSMPLSQENNQHSQTETVVLFTMQENAFSFRLDSFIWEG